MNRRHRAWAASLLTVGICAGAARAQQPATPGTPAAGAPGAPAAAAPAAAPAPATISQNAYNNPTAGKAEIDAFVKANVDALTNEADPAAQSRSRENLVQGPLVNGAPATPAFLFEYGRSLDAALSGKIDPKASSLRARVNVAIVAARVAYVTSNITLQNTVMKLLADPAEPVVLWAIKAAQPLVPQAVSLKIGNAKPPLLDAITGAVFRHPSGAIFEEAYVALGGLNDALVFNELMKLWENRLEQYRKGIPEDPAVDGKPVFQLTTREAWNGVLKDPKLRTTVMQMIADQVYMAAQHADATKAGNQHDQLVELVQQCAAACSVLGTNQKLPGLTAAASQAANMRPATLPQGTLVKPMIDPALIAAIRAAFPDVKAPEPVKVAADAGGGTTTPPTPQPR